jgi:hypothetical protein
VCPTRMQRASRSYDTRNQSQGYYDARWATTGVVKGEFIQLQEVAVLFLFRLM